MHQYELLPTDRFSPTQRSGKRRTRRAPLSFPHFSSFFRPYQLLYIFPPLTVFLLSLDYIHHGEFTFWSYFQLNSTRGSTLRYAREGGLAYLDEVKTGDVHPILELIEMGKRKHGGMKEKKSKVRTLEDAVVDYRENFGMMPPEGFERWYDFAVSHNSTSAPSLIPFAHTSVLPYLSLPADLLQKRAIEMQDQRGVFGMTLHPESSEERIGISNEDDVTGYMSPRWDYPKLLESIIPFLPPNQQPDRPVQISACVKDGSCRLSHGDLMEKSRNLAKQGQVWDEAELVALENQYEDSDELGWPMTCPPQPPKPESDSDPDAGQVSFIHDFMEYMDFCTNPELVKLNGEMIMEEQHVMRPLAPMLAVSRLIHGADMIGVPTRAVNDTHDFEPWAEKNRSQVVWRGTITGIFHRERWDWRSSQRDRLAKLTATGQALDEDEMDVLVEEGGGLERKGYKRRELVDRWMNVGVINEDIDNMCGVGPTGEACRLDGKHDVPCMVDHACEEMRKEIRFKESMANRDALPYKYRFDIDGYGWSSRFRKLLSSNSLIIKSTVYPEWWSAQAIPWYHFVPMKYDYSDMFDIVSFFDGPPDDRVHPSQGRQWIRDGLAEEIAANGRRFALEQLRWVDMQSYMFLFLLEYRRAWSLDRDLATYKPSV